MGRIEARRMVGILLLVGGVLLLLQNLGVLAFRREVLGASLFVAGGLAFLALFLSDRDRWWAAIPAFALLAMGMMIVLHAADPLAARHWAGPLFLGGMGLGFWVAYLARPQFWWAIVPGGVLLTLAVVAGGSHLTGGSVGGALFFFGLAITFGLVYLLPSAPARPTWALITAAVLFVLGLITAAAASAVVNYVWPLMLIGLGLYLVLRSLRVRRS